jgi:hypothetical protein
LVRSARRGPTGPGRATGGEEGTPVARTGTQTPPTESGVDSEGGSAIPAGAATTAPTAPNGYRRGWPRL